MMTESVAAMVGPRVCGRAEAELVSHVKQIGMFGGVFCSLWLLLFL